MHRALNAACRDRRCGRGRTRRHFLADALVVALLGSALLAATAPQAGALAPAKRYASPNGMGMGCTQHHPCSLYTAITDAAAGSRVIITPGKYGKKAAPLTTVLADTNPGLDIYGQSAKHPPVIWSDAAYGFDLLNGSSLRNVAIHFSGMRTAIAAEGGAISHIRAFATAGLGACAVLGGTLTESLCVSTAKSSSALSAVDGFLSPTALGETLQGDTLEASGKHSTGLSLSAGENTTMSYRAVNTIIGGDKLDIQAGTHAPTGTATLTLSHCDFRSVSTSSDGGAATVRSAASDISAKPRFIDASGGNFEEKASSPTVDAGSRDPARSDLAGNKRTQGKRTDIGAFEFAS